VRVRPSPIGFALLGGTGNRLKSKTTANLKEKKNLDRHGLRPITNICLLLGPPSFSLQTTFKIKLFYFIWSTVQYINVQIVHCANPKPRLMSDLHVQWECPLYDERKTVFCFIFWQLEIPECKKVPQWIKKIIKRVPEKGAKIKITIQKSQSSVYCNGWESSKTCPLIYKN
jgi:hypothetical protein